MTLFIPFFRSQSPPKQAPATARAVSQHGVQWDRPRFKAPPLQLESRVPVPANLAMDGFEGGRIQR
jgi:hypothetical protein